MRSRIQFSFAAYCARMIKYTHNYVKMAIAWSIHVNSVGCVLKVGMKQKLQSSFLPYCDHFFPVYLSEMASQARKNVGQELILDGCGLLLVDLM